MKGQAFDRAYLREMTRINKEDKSTFRRESRNTQDQQIQQFVQHAASMDQTHESMVQSLQTTENTGTKTGMQAGNAAGLTSTTQ